MRTGYQISHQNHWCAAQLSTSERGRRVTEFILNIGITGTVKVILSSYFSTSFPGLFPPLPISREKPWERGWLFLDMLSSSFTCNAIGTIPRSLPCTSIVQRTADVQIVPYRAAVRGECGRKVEFTHIFHWIHPTRERPSSLCRGISLYSKHRPGY